MEENTTVDIGQINEKIAEESAFIELLTLEMNKTIVGQKHMLERLLIGLLGRGPYPIGGCTWTSKNTCD